MAERLIVEFRGAEDGGPEAIARRDIEDGLDAWFSPQDIEDEPAFRIRSDLTGVGEIRNSRVSVVPWQYHVIPDPAVWGVAAEREDVFVDGVTFVDLETDDCSRIIDWHGLFMRLGVAAAGHIVTEPGLP